MPRLLPIVTVLLAGALAGACAPATALPTGQGGTPAPPTEWPSTAAPTGAAPSATAADPAGGGPPSASLAAEGGDPVMGQPGTYTWGDTGSSSPWLPGSPIAVGSGEPLTVVFDPAFPVDSWAARRVAAGSDGPAGAVLLGQGVGTPAFAAPGPGSWTVELRASFSAGAGTASWFWRLDVP